MTDMSNAKPYEIPKRLVWNAWLAVKANRGAAGVDGQTIDDFEANLEKGLYKIWNLDHNLLMKAVRHKTDNAWAILYIERWLKAGIVFADGACTLPQRGTPLGFGFLRRSTVASSRRG
jgi:retron-type reverse transcriptase